MLKLVVFEGKLSGVTPNLCNKVLVMKYFLANLLCKVLKIDFVCTITLILGCYFVFKIDTSIFLDQHISMMSLRRIITKILKTLS